MASLYHKITRKKPLDNKPTSLHRCLTTFDLTMMGVGSMVGSGIYITTGITARDLAGPSVLVSFLVASVIISLAAACFTEFATRVHRTGSAYLYVYVAFGELPAFITGWCIIISATCAGAITSRTWSGYLDNLLDGAIANFTRTNVAEWTVGTPIAEYPDLLGCVIVIIMTIVVSLGANVSSGVNNIIVVINVVVLLFVAVVGFVYSDIENWTSEDTGGFMPYGVKGIIAGSGACFWALSGFESISATAEEAKTPKKSIPVATGFAVVLVTILYIAMSAAITLMTSYQNIDRIAPLPSAFQARGITWAQYVAAIGPMIGLLAALLNCIYFPARYLYAISDDGLLPAVFGRINRRTKTPLVSTLVYGVIVCLITVFLDLEEILDFSIVILIGQHILVAVGVLLLRYRDEAQKGGPNDQYSSLRYGAVDANEQSTNSLESSCKETSDADSLLRSNKRTDTSPLIHASGGTVGLKPSFHFTRGLFKPCRGKWVPIAIFFVFISLFLLSFLLIYGISALAAGAWWAIFLTCCLCVFVVILEATIWIHQQNISSDHFRVPGVPIIPSMSVFVSSIVLAASGTPISWLMFGIIVALSIVAYFAYGIRHSKLNAPPAVSSSSDETTKLLAEEDEQPEEET